MEAPEIDQERFWRFVSKSEGCWEWMGSKMGIGYGSFRPYRGAQSTGAHRVSFAIHTGRWPQSGLVVMHSCDNPACVNPSHLEEGPQSANIQQCVDRGRHKPFRKPKADYCANGHEYTPANTEFVLSRGLNVRRCRECHAAKNREWRARKHG